MKVKNKITHSFFVCFVCFHNLPYWKQNPEWISSFRIFRIRSHPRRCSTPSVDESRKRNKKSISHHQHHFTLTLLHRSMSLTFSISPKQTGMEPNPEHQNHTRFLEQTDTSSPSNCLPQTDVCVSSNVLEAVSNGKAHTRRSETAIRVANYAAAHTARVIILCAKILKFKLFMTNCIDIYIHTYILSRTFTKDMSKLNVVQLNLVQYH